MTVAAAALIGVPVVTDPVHAVPARAVPEDLGAQAASAAHDALIAVPGLEVPEDLADPVGPAPRAPVTPAV